MRTLALAINRGAAGLTLAALVGGLSLRGLQVDPALPFALFILILRFKILLDDEVYFRSPSTNVRSVHFRTGLLLGVVCYVLIAASGGALRDLQNAYMLALAGIVTGTLWVIDDALRKGASREQYYWLATNALYVGLLGFLLWMPTGAPAAWEWAATSALVAVAFLDLWISKSFERTEDLDEKDGGDPGDVG